MGGLKFRHWMLCSALLGKCGEGNRAAVGAPLNRKCRAPDSNLWRNPQHWQVRLPDHHRLAGLLSDCPCIPDCVRLICYLVPVHFESFVVGLHHARAVHLPPPAKRASRIRWARSRALRCNWLRNSIACISSPLKTSETNLGYDVRLCCCLSFCVGLVFYRALRL